ncbi:MAG: tetratricopeptide (TPR) repeat protein [Paraglaciecola sp.]|jgi:tetratricopeptide (TPR) repeat protein
MSLSKLQQAADLFNLGDLVQAERLYSEVLISHPSCGHAYLGMGVIALKAQRFDKAVSFFTKSCELLPNEAIPLIHLSEAFNGVNSEIDGLTVLEYAANHLPNNATVHYRLGLQHIMWGDLTKGEHSFKKVIQLSQDAITSYALFELTRLDNHPEQYLPLLKERLLQTKITSQETTVLHYALGNVLHGIKDYSQAWQNFETANTLQSKLCNFKTSELKGFFQQIKISSSKDVLSICRTSAKNNPIAEIIPVFIVGLPRTGSTLLEFLLTEHQDISSAGEAPYLSCEVAKYLFSQTKSHYPYSISNISDEQMNTAAQIYLEKMSIHANGKGYVIDKLPANFQSMGLIYKLFPNAKILHLKRNLPDVALSIYRNYFAQNEPYFCSLNEFKQYHSLYSDLMDFWNTQLPEFIHEVSYENLVENKHQTIKAILEFCGLSSQINDSKALKANKVVKTLSNIQIRQPMSTTVVNNWYNYSEQLSQFRDVEHGR